MRFIQCNNCANLKQGWCEKVIDSPDPGITRDCDHYRVMTNSDRIRNATDEELAELLNDTITHWQCPPRKEFSSKLCGRSPTCNSCWLKWLQEEAVL